MTDQQPRRNGTPPSDLTIAYVAWNRISVKLQMISDAPVGQAFDTRPTTRPPHHGESREPKGVRLNRSATAPSKQFSLWAHYQFRADQAIARKDAGELLKLAACATRDYEIHQRLRPAFHENHEAAVTELLRDCTGMSSAEASWWLGAPSAWVRRQRVLSGREAEYGESVKRDPKTQKILSMKANGATTRAIAEECGVSTGYVSKVVNGETRAA